MYQPTDPYLSCALDKVFLIPADYTSYGRLPEKITWESFSSCSRDNYLFANVVKTPVAVWCGGSANGDGEVRCKHLSFFFLFFLPQHISSLKSNAFPFLA